MTRRIDSNDGSKGYWWDLLLIPIALMVALGIYFAALIVMILH